MFFSRFRLVATQPGAEMASAGAEPQPGVALAGPTKRAPSEEMAVSSSRTVTEEASRVSSEHSHLHRTPPRVGGRACPHAGSLVTLQSPRSHPGPLVSLFTGRGRQAGGLQLRLRRGPGAPQPPIGGGHILRGEQPPGGAPPAQPDGGGQAAGVPIRLGQAAGGAAAQGCGSGVVLA